MTTDELVDRLLRAAAMVERYDNATSPHILGTLTRADCLTRLSEERYDYNIYRRELMRRLDLSPEERDAETAGLTLTELRSAKAICESVSA